jgi:hypothetical protein
MRTQAWVDQERRRWRARLMGCTCVVALAGLLAGCAGTAPGDSVAPDPADRFATVAELTGPWRSEPLTLDSATIDEVDRVCRPDPDSIPGIRLVVIDARGNGKLTAQYNGPGGFAECRLEVAPGGAISGHLGNLEGWRGNHLAPGCLEIDDQGVGRRREGWQGLNGQAGTAVMRVVIDVVDAADVDHVGPVTASLHEGKFLAWWPLREPGASRDATGRLDIWERAYTITAYDAFGHVTDRVDGP